VKNKRNQLLSLAPSTYFTIQCASQRDYSLYLSSVIPLLSSSQSGFNRTVGGARTIRSLATLLPPGFPNWGCPIGEVAGSQRSEELKTPRSLVRQGTPGFSPVRWLQCPSNVRLACLKLASSSRVLYASLQHTSNQTQNLRLCLFKIVYTLQRLSVTLPPNHVWWLLYCPAC